jgi:hypothetical protein
MTGMIIPGVTNIVSVIREMKIGANRSPLVFLSLNTNSMLNGVR